MDKATITRGANFWKRPATGKYGAEAYPNMVTRAVERVSNVD